MNVNVYGLVVNQTTDEIPNRPINANQTVTGHVHGIVVNQPTYEIPNNRIDPSETVTDHALVIGHYIDSSQVFMTGML